MFWTLSRYCRDVTSAPDTETRIEAAARLGESGNPKAVPSLVAALSSLDSLEKGTNGSVLEQRLKGRGTSWGPAASALADVREAVAVALGRLGDAQAADALLPLIGPENPEKVRLAAIGALGRLADPRAAEPLALLMQGSMGEGSGEVAVRSAVLDALGNIGSSEALPAVVTALRAPRTTEEARRALLYLARKHPQEARAHLVGLLADGNLALKRIAARMLEALRLPAETSEERVYRALLASHAYAQVIAEGAVALQILVRVTPELRDPEDLRTAVQALGMSSHPDAVAALAGLFPPGTSRGRFEDAEWARIAVDGLVRALRSHASQLPRPILVAMSKAGDMHCQSSDEEQMKLVSLGEVRRLAAAALL